MRNHRVKGVRLLIVLGLLIGAPGQGRAQSLDPQSLLGEWVGTWAGKLASANGPYRLTVEAVDGDKVRGHVDTTGSTRQQNAPVTFPIRGVLRGNHLTYGTKNYEVDLEVNGSEMRGTWTGLAHRDITLTKK